MNAFCGHCDGDGEFVACAGQPREYLVMCVECGGEGRSEVCASCGEPLEIVGGVEVCDCLSQAVAA